MKVLGWFAVLNTTASMWLYADGDYARSAVHIGIAIFLLQATKL